MQEPRNKAGFENVSPLDICRNAGGRLYIYEANLTKIFIGWEIHLTPFLNENGDNINSMRTFVNYGILQKRKVALLL